MGDSKLEIVLLGDTVNTAARIEQCCREFDRDFLVSAETLALIDLPDGTECERMPMAAAEGHIAARSSCMPFGRQTWKTQSAPGQVDVEVGP